MAVGELLGALHERDGRRDVSAFALDRLDEERGDILGRTISASRRSMCASDAAVAASSFAAEVAIRGGERGDLDVRQQRVVARPVVQVRRRHAQRAIGPSVEATGERDDVVRRRAAGELDGSVDDLGARVAEEHGVERLGHLVREHLREADDRLHVAEAVADVEQLVDLLVDRGCGCAWPSDVTAMPFAKSR